MKRLVLQMQMSVDGFVGGDVPHDWQVWDWGSDCPWDADLKRDFNVFFQTIDTILLSRKMAEEGYLNHWAGAAKRFPEDRFYAFAQKITQVQKVVLSSKLENSRWERTTVGRGDLPREVDVIKRGSGGNIAVFGGVGFASALIAADLVDEYQFFINPAALGSGQRLFAQTGFRRLKLLGSKSYDCGIVVDRYTPAGSSQCQPEVDA
ncbi:dihydrofolate reductase family protein [Rhodanobacter ginsengisoli]|uniref:Dihydrofolate reductase family protein n=1 Tax=Rhodanobacter ginsengisoli TaxID=418646 RepID=A0ABW0QIY0_9GAMM